MPCRTFREMGATAKIATMTIAETTSRTTYWTRRPIYKERESRPEGFAALRCRSSGQCQQAPAENRVPADYRQDADHVQQPTRLPQRAGEDQAGNEHDRHRGSH